jgi:uncharacterized repeat protein (TIGR03803 family)
MTPAGVSTNIHYFQLGTTDGIEPFAPLMQDTNGLFYGTTSGGGARGYGTIYQIDSSGNFSLIYSFTNGIDGSDPYAGVFQGSDGYLYGTTFYGGSSNVGAAYKVSLSGQFVPLHQFGANSNDGQYPVAGIIQGWTGNYFGTTFSGGTNGDGTIYSMTSSGVLTYIYNFGNFTFDGLNPRCPLLQGSDSYLYGTTYLGGTNGNAGTLFKIGPTGGIIYLHDFDGFPGDGAFPTAQPVEGSDGDYYGTTYQGGSNQIGIVYKLSAAPSMLNPNQPGISDNGISGGNSSTNTTNNVVLAFAAVAGETYHLQSTASLYPPVWSNVPGGNVTNAIGGPLLITNLITNTAQQFYRLQIIP